MTLQLTLSARTHEALRDGLKFYGGMREGTGGRPGYEGQVKCLQCGRIWVNVSNPEDIPLYCETVH